MQSLDLRHVMSVGSDGSLVLASVTRYQKLRQEMMEVFNNWSSRAAQSSVDILAGLSPEYAGDDRGLDLKVLASPDVMQAMRYHNDRLTRAKKQQQSDSDKAKEEAEKEKNPPTQDQGVGGNGDRRGRDDESTTEGAPVLETIFYCPTKTSFPGYGSFRCGERQMTCLFLLRTAYIVLF